MHILYIEYIMYISYNIYTLYIICYIYYYIIYNKSRSIGLRLEDLKKFPNTTLHALCKWMGVK